MSINENSGNPDVVLIGAGIMSATLGVMLKQLEPGLTIEIFETLDVAAAESSDAWNNAGTGHSAFCELNYTPQHEDGSIDISKAVKIAESFEVSQRVLGLPYTEKFYIGATFFYPANSSHEFCLGRGKCRFFEEEVRIVNFLSPFQGDAIHRRQRGVMRMDPLGNGRS